MDRVVGLRLRQFQRVTGLPAVFGGATTTAAAGPQLRIGHVRGGQSLLGLRVDPGRGLGGAAIRSAELRAVRDYASARTITHDFDDLVVQQERMRSLFALPLVVGGEVHGVLYGAVRGPHRIGDVVLDRAVAFGASLEREISTALTPELPAEEHGVGTRARRALTVLRELASTTADRELGAKLFRLADDLSCLQRTDAPTSPELPAVRPPSGAAVLAPREIEVLRLVAVGMSNGDIAQAMHLSIETVRSYLRSASRRLDVHNRTAAVHAARALGLL